MKPAVVLDGVRKRFGDLTVLDGVSLTVAPGEVVALIGSSGSGKSTLLRCVNGLEAHDEGRVEVLGVEVPTGRVRPRAREAAWAPLRARIGFVFQAFHLYPHRTALDNVTLAPCVVRGIEREKAEASRRRCSGAWGSPTRWTRGRASSPAASASASPSRGRSPWSRAPCCSTSRRARSTPRPWARCSRSCATWRRSTPARCSWSRTRSRSRRARPTAWRSSTAGASSRRARPRRCSAIRGTRARARSWERLR